jgi:hypothetical protein
MKILIEVMPVLIMIGFIPLVLNDYLLMSVYILIICIAFYLKKERKEFLIFGVGFVVMIISEYIFISTGVETFQRNSLLGVMPIWLPFLWAYTFVVMKRVIKYLSL